MNKSNILPVHVDIAESLSWITAMCEILLKQGDFKEADRTKRIAIEYQAFALSFLAMSREVQELYWKQAETHVAKKLKEMNHIMKGIQNE